MFASVKLFFSSAKNIVSIILFIAFLVAGNYVYNGWHKGQRAIEKVGQLEQANKDLKESIEHATKIQDKYQSENALIRDAISSIKPSVSVRHIIERVPTDNQAISDYAQGIDDLYVTCENEYRGMAEEASRASATAFALNDAFDASSVRIKAEKLKTEVRK